MQITKLDEALDCLTPNEQAAAMHGLALYLKAHQRLIKQEKYKIRKLKKSDVPIMLKIIKNVLEEYNYQPDYTNVYHETLETFYSIYNNARSRYYVILDKNKIVGGGGIRTIPNVKNICELKRMYFLPTIRGIGLGAKLLKKLLNDAQKIGYKKCYLETSVKSPEANQLYLEFGFEPLMERLAHKTKYQTTCECWYIKKL